MKKVKFLQDFQGVETRNVFYEKDVEIVLEDGIADRVVEDGRAVYVINVVPHDNIQQFENAAEPPTYAEPVVSDTEAFVKARKRGK